MKFAGPTKKMSKALEAEGLRIDWPTDLHDEEQLAFDGLFCTGKGWEKSLVIDLRGEENLGTKEKVDRLVAAELRECSDNFDIEEELRLWLEMDAQERARRGVPPFKILLADKEEEERRLKRFAEVAEAVAEGRPIPPREKPAKDGEAVHLSALDANMIIDYLWFAYPCYNNLGKSEVSGLIYRLCDKIGRECNFRFGGVRAPVKSEKNTNAPLDKTE